MAAKKKKKVKKETKGERTIRIQRQLEFDLRYGEFGYPYSSTATRETS